mmetsp:Transcript_41649/g.120652  ORF Transcript_41649/g.120652 Transcript_41649/m.120652 type:complete len:244 (-) Transcript_41649:1213-1944(-)
MVVGGWGQRQELQPVRGDAVALKLPGEARLDLPRVEALRLHKQSAVGHLLQHARPQGKALGVDLGQAAEAPEGHEAVCRCGQWADVGDPRRGRVAEEAAGQPHELLAEGLAAVGGVHHRVGDAVVDRAKARGIVVPYVGELDRRWFQRQDIEPIVCRVPSQFDQDVDSVFSYHACNLVSRLAQDLPPAVLRNHLLESGGRFVLSGGVRVQDYVKLLLVSMLQQTLGEEGHRVVEEVWGDVAHP